MSKKEPDRYQKKVIKTRAKNVLVIAGAGSGKTYTIVMKIKYLIKRGIKPDEILCISFTKAASKNLEERLKPIKIKVKTFHSLGLEIIKKYKNIKIVEDEMMNKIINDELRKSNVLNKIIKLNFKRIGTNDEIFDKLENNIIINTKYKEYLLTTIKQFINIYKNTNRKQEDFKIFHQINDKENIYNQKKRHHFFLILTEKILKKYEKFKKKNNYIDYNDMINEAIKIIKMKAEIKYKYIIIDEYQDISLNKLKLIEEIQKNSNAKLLAVGDDWQSIYEFTGSILEVFTKFKRIFKHSKIIKLKNTYRNSSELIKITKKFICKNKYQISKTLKSKISNQYPIYIYYYESKIDEIWEKVREKVKNTQVLILGRNNKDINKIPKIDKNMKFLTMHKCKGLETDNTVIINLENSYNSIPSKVEENEFLKYVKPKTNEMKYAEERRLFYVALTRCRNSNYLIVKKNNPSVFVEELLKDNSKYINVK